MAFGAIVDAVVDHLRVGTLDRHTLGAFPFALFRASQSNQPPN